MTSKLKRIFTDIGGYFLILLGVATGWLPGPGGIPLILAGLGLLSLNNEWARRGRDWVIANSKEFLHKLFPRHLAVQAIYDIIALILIGAIIWLILHHAHPWQIGLAVTLFCIDLVIIGENRERYKRVKHKIKKARS